MAAAESASLEPLLGNGTLRAAAAEATGLGTLSLLGGLVTFDRRRWACKEAEIQWTAPSHVIVLTERGMTTTTQIYSESRRIYQGSDRPGALSFVPAGVERSGYFHEADLVYSALWLDPSLDLPGCSALLDRPIRVNGSDEVVRSLIGSLAAEVSAGHLPDSVYLDHLVSLVSLRLANGGPDESPGKRRRRLGPQLVKRLTEYIESRLDSDISLTDLARLACMPVDTFSRHFRAETGMAPYAYVLERRVRRAEALLQSSAMPISLMALELGFSSQSHFTSTFRRLTGTTPHLYRRHRVRDADILPHS